MESTNEAKEMKHVRLSRYYRIFLFFVMVGIESILNVSSGIFSSATKEIKSMLNLSDTRFGSFGTANSVGRVASSIFFGIFNQSVSRRWTTTIFVTLHAFFLFIFNQFLKNIKK